MKKNRRLTRRNLLKNLSFAAGAAVLPGGALAIPRFFSPANRRGEILLPGKTEAVPLKLQPFPMTQVRLRAGIFQKETFTEAFNFELSLRLVRNPNLAANGRFPTPFRDFKYEITP